MKTLALDIPGDKPVAMLTVAELTGVIVAAIGKVGADDDAPRDADAIRKIFPNATDGWLKAHVVACGRGARRCRQYRPSAVRAALEATPVAPRPPRKSRAIQLENEDPIDAMLRHGELVARRGR